MKGKTMNEINAYYYLVLHRFFEKFKSITYRGVAICKYTYYPFLNYLIGRRSTDPLKEDIFLWQDEISRLNESEIYGCLDEPYHYDPHPNGVILMRGGFGDLASLYLPKERIFLLSPNQAEVDLIKTNRPDLTAHNIENYYQENPNAVAKLTVEITQIIHEQKNDPILGSLSLEHWFASKISDIVRTLDATYLLFEKLNIGAVLTISSIYWMDGALNLMAKANRIPSLTLQHGLIIDRDIIAHIPILATKKLVWGKATLEWYRKYGYPENRISVIGSPRFDIIFNRKWRNKEELCQLLGIVPSQKIMVYATRPSGLSENVPSIVINGLKSIPELFLLILLHPSEGTLVEQYQQLTGDFPNCKVVRFGHITLYDALNGADFFITYDSTAALEAMLFKLPVITVEPSHVCFSYGDAGATIRVTSSAELNQIIKRLLADETYRTNASNQYQNFLSDYCIPDGSASKRLFAEVELLCQTGGTA
jgi:hypothetical protein